jgi:hypothetical protein
MYIVGGESKWVVGELKWLVGVENGWWPVETVAGEPKRLVVGGSVAAATGGCDGGREP